MSTYTIVYRTVTVDLESGEERTGVDSEPMDVDEDSIKQWVKTGTRPWERV